MHWISTHSAADIANKLPSSLRPEQHHLARTSTSRRWTPDKGQFLPDGIMPAGGPKVIFAMEKAIGVDTSKVTIADTFTNKYAQAANKLEGFTPTTTPAGADG